MGAIIDALVSMATMVPVAIATGFFQQVMNGQDMTIGQTALYAGLSMVGFLLVNGYLLAKHGQTIGKRLVNTRIVHDAMGTVVPLSRSYGLRYLPLAVIAQVPIVGGLFALVDCLFVFRSDRRCIHDLIAGTKVIDA